MSITKFIASKCTQPIVYWANPVSDGFMGSSYDVPVQIYGRWEELNEVIIGNNGQELISQARVFLTQEVDEDGRLWLGSIDDLESASDPDDSSVGALYILAQSRLPKLGSATMDVFRANCNMTGRTTV